MATSAIVFNYRPIAFYLGLQSQPFFDYYTTDTGHVGGVPMLLLESGIEADVGPVALGASGAFGLIALALGPHVRIHAGSSPFWEHDIEIRAAWLPPRSAEAAILYSPSHIWTKNR